MYTMSCEYKCIVSLYENLTNELVELKETSEEWTNYIMYGCEALLFVYELMTGNMKEVFDSIGISGFNQILIFIVISLIVIPLLNLLAKKLIFLLHPRIRKLKLFFNIPDKKMYHVFYKHILPLCLAFDKSTTLSHREKIALKSILCDIKDVLKQYGKINDMFVSDDSNKNRQKNRIKSYDFKYCNEVVENFLSNI